ncbi:MAG: Cell division ATP-binding protein FtsE [Candidatus Accumulibacter appositus]|uniref:Cell division ATP-binding protein FtsE n=1 Tax=Candidatus Accumulibacter appositus TaxID=1454003 RepID=A0A011NXC7_9PROT|nr:ATP-binding cassette domain-containing protein [Accumulibacter sp.]EXI79956.1 MAG: Cell division ATP-binding protein FtsE [Candidatus Accumulibacter appositus]HRF04119.1 ATP-binding cassette domain-containing protein [Accumulibacter sp.]
MFCLHDVELTHANGFVALREIALALQTGEQLAIVGPSGAGKTTLLRLISAALRPSKGRIDLLGGDPWALSAAELRRLRTRIGVAHQAPPLPPRQRVVTAVLAGRLGQWPWWKGIASLAYPVDVTGACAALARLELGERIFDRCDRLSGGQLQRVGIARVLYQQAQLVLADEPVSALDPALALQTVKVLCDDAAARGATLVASLHAVDLARSCFPRIVGMREGRIVFDLPVAAVDDVLLSELYATEGGGLPLLAGEQPGTVPPTVEAGLPRRGTCWR